MASLADLIVVLINALFLDTVSGYRGIFGPIYKIQDSLGAGQGLYRSCCVLGIFWLVVRSDFLPTVFITANV
jgi:hypothetical protein